MPNDPNLDRSVDTARSRNDANILIAVRMAAAAVNFVVRFYFAILVNPIVYSAFPGNLDRYRGPHEWLLVIGMFTAALILVGFVVLRASIAILARRKLYSETEALQWIAYSGAALVTLVVWIAADLYGFQDAGATIFYALALVLLAGAGTLLAMRHSSLLLKCIALAEFIIGTLLLFLLFLHVASNFGPIVKN